MGDGGQCDCLPVPILRKPVEVAMSLLAARVAGRHWRHMPRHRRGWELTPSGGASPLGIRQQRVERMMADLERKFKTLKLALQQTEPERAERLQQTLNKAKELLIQKRMGDITKLLDQTQFDTATDGQKALLADIRALLALLLDEKSDRDKAREEYERLDQWKRQIAELIHAERGEKRESDRLANKEQTLADVAAKIKALEDAIQAEKQIIAATLAARSEGIQGLGKIAADQQATRDKTEAIANQIAREAGDERGPFEPQPAPPMANPPAADAPLAAAGSPALAEPPQTTRPAEPAEKPLAAAVKQQRQAEGNLQQGKGKAAQQDEENALANLQRALAELKQESQRIASLPPEAFDKLARKQDDIAGQTGELSQKMQHAAQPSDGGQGGGKPQPGQQKVAQAQKSMQQASGGLRQQDPSDASRQQGKAIKELNERCRKSKNGWHNCVRKRSSKSWLLEARFRDMLSIQQRLTRNGEPGEEATDTAASSRAATATRYGHRR
jgi:uncharacterized protein YgfB (UPF0149 family)